MSFAILLFVFVLIKNTTTCSPVFLGLRFNNLQRAALMMSFWCDWLNINPLTPRAFCKKGVSWTFWWFSGWILAKLALIWSKMHLHHDSLVFLPLASWFATFWLGHAQKSKFWDEKVTYVFRLFDFWNFFWPFLFLLFFPFCCSDWPSTGLGWS